MAKKKNEGLQKNKAPWMHVGSILKKIALKIFESGNLLRLEDNFMGLITDEKKIVKSLILEEILHTSLTKFKDEKGTTINLFQKNTLKDMRMYDKIPDVFREQLNSDTFVETVQLELKKQIGDIYVEDAKIMEDFLTDKNNIKGQHLAIREKTDVVFIKFFQGGANMKDSPRISPKLSKLRKERKKNKGKGKNSRKRNKN